MSKSSFALAPHQKAPVYLLTSCAMVSAIIVACAAGTPPQTQEVQFAASSTAAGNLGEQHPTPTPGNSAATSTPLPTPELSTSLLQGDILFGEGIDPDCHLPCWQGLRVGESGHDAIQTMFVKVFGFDETHDLIQDPPPDYVNQFLPPELYGFSHSWTFDRDGNLRSFAVGVIYEKHSFLLRAIQISSNYLPFNANVSPQRIIREMGKPSDFLILVTPTERGDIGNVRLRLVYDDIGMIFTYEVLTPMSYAIFESKIEGSLEFCLGGQRWSTGDYGDGLFGVFIFEPFRWEAPPMLVKTLITNFDQVEMIPAQDFFHTTLDNIVQLAGQHNDACLDTRFSEDRGN